MVSPCSEAVAARGVDLGAAVGQLVLQLFDLKDQVFVVFGEIFIGLLQALLLLF